MTNQQIKTGLSSLEMTHPFYLALLELLKSDADDEVEAAVAPDLADGARHFNAGRAAHARDIHRAVEGLVIEAWKERVT